MRRRNWRCKVESLYSLKSMPLTWRSPWRIGARGMTSPGKGLAIHSPPSATRLASNWPIAAGSSTRSAPPRWMAERGMPSKRAVSGVCTRVRPPQARTESSPRAPSEPVPESTTATPFSPQCSAIDSNSWSMQGLGVKRGSGSRSRSRSPSTRRSRLGGPTTITPGARRSPSAAATTGRVVAWASRSTIRLGWSGERCWATT